MILTRGPGTLADRPAALGPGRAIVIVEPLAPLSRALSLATVDFPLPRRASAGHKTLAYLDHLLARELAREAGADEALRLDADGFVAEGATSNLFIVTSSGAGGVLATPELRGVLPGVTRARILRLAAQLAIPARVAHLSLAEVQAADEIFATSAVRGVVPVTRLDGKDRVAGPIAARLAAAYEREFRL